MTHADTNTDTNTDKNTDPDKDTVIDIDIYLQDSIPKFQLPRTTIKQAQRLAKMAR